MTEKEKMQSQKLYDKNCLMGSIIKCPNVKSDNKSKFITDT